MAQRLTRRSFLGRSAAAGMLAGGYFVGSSAARASRSPNEKLNIGVVGVANKGGHNVAQLTGENIVALCDIDANYLGTAGEQFPAARRYRDYRKMLDEEKGQIDAVVVSTADHNHAPATSIALGLGKHVYCEKPLTHTVAEARAIAQLAARQKVATQMGTQVHASDNYRRVVEVVRSGAIGNVSEVYNWCNKGWANGRFKPWRGEVPQHIDWDLWLGPAPRRPYSPDVHPGQWRRFWDYGSGTFGDMACHIMDLPFWALELKHPTSIVCEGPDLDLIGCPSWTRATYEFPRADEQGPLKFYWSDGGAHFDLVADTKDHAGKPLSSWGLGVLFVGDRGMLAADYGRYQLLPQEQFNGYEPPEPTIPASIGHWNEWVQACKTGSPTLCNFDYAGALTETVLLGIVAFRSGGSLNWDAENLKTINAPNAQRFLTKRYRPGWEVVGLGGVG